MLGGVAGGMAGKRDGMPMIDRVAYRRPTPAASLRRACPAPHPYTSPLALGISVSVRRPSTPPLFAPKLRLKRRGQLRLQVSDVAPIVR